MERTERISVSWTWGIRCNSPRGWRQQAGQALLRLAGWIDGRWLLAVDISAKPALPNREISQCLRAGLEHANRLVGDSARNACFEEALRQARPDLYEQDTP